MSCNLALLIYLVCQGSIGGFSWKSCSSCVINGARKCDPDGCPITTVYVNTTQMCEGKIFYCKY